MQESKSYKSILKGTALFGGVQVFNILINIIRGKLVAMILGPSGMGVTSLLNNVSALVQQFSSLGINYSAVRSISNAKNNTDETVLAKNITAYKKLLHITAILGASITLLFSKPITTFTFGDDKYQTFVILLSLAIVFQTLTNGEQAILQGLRELKKIAFSTTIGPLCGLLVGVPLYFFFGLDGIVPAMIILSLISYSIVKYYTQKLEINKITLTVKEIWSIGKEMISLGIVFIAATLIGTITTYLINAFIRNTGSLNDVGLYQAANSITNQYVGLVFAAMATDYYPKLSAVIHDRIKMKSHVDQQLEIVLLIVTPIVITIIITAPILIRILLTEDFLQITDIIRIMGFSVLFKATVFPVGYISFAKGDKKYFFYVEGIYTNIKTLLVFILFYYLYGLKGLGYAALCSSVLDLIVTIVLNRWRYKYQLSKIALSLLMKCIIISVICLLSSYIANIYISTILMGITLIISYMYSYKELDKRIELTKLLKTKITHK